MVGCHSRDRSSEDLLLVIETMLFHQALQPGLLNITLCPLTW